MGREQAVNKVDAAPFLLVMVSRDCSRSRNIAGKGAVAYYSNFQGTDHARCLDVKLKGRDIQIASLHLVQILVNGEDEGRFSPS